MFRPKLRVQRLRSQPDSLRLTLYLAPQDSLRVGRRQRRYVLEPAQPDVPVQDIGYEEPWLPPTLHVQWQDARHRPQQQRLRPAHWLQQPLARVRHSATSRLERHYLDYPAPAK